LTSHQVFFYRDPEAFKLANVALPKLTISMIPLSQVLRATFILTTLPRSFTFSLFLPSLTRKEVFAFIHQFSGGAGFPPQRTSSGSKRIIPDPVLPEEKFHHECHSRIRYPWNPRPGVSHSPSEPSMDPRVPWILFAMLFEYLVGLHSFGQPFFSWMMDRTSLSHFVLLLLLKVPTRGHFVKLWRGYVRRSGWSRKATHDGADEASLLQSFFEDLKSWTGHGHELVFSFIRYISSLLGPRVFHSGFFCFTFWDGHFVPDFPPIHLRKGTTIAQASIKIKSPAVFKLGYSGTLFPFCHISSSMVSGRASITTVPIMSFMNTL